MSADMRYPLVSRILTGDPEPRSGYVNFSLTGDYKTYMSKALDLCSTLHYDRLCERTGLRPHCPGKVKDAQSDKVSSPKYDILITPPNRLVYQLQHDPPLINLDKVQWLVVDEADKLFEVRNEEDVILDGLNLCSFEGRSEWFP